jgi:hypothetical protein
MMLAVFPPAQRGALQERRGPNRDVARRSWRAYEGYADYVGMFDQGHAGLWSEPMNHVVDAGRETGLLEYLAKHLDR